jgi:hypothetical protein
MQAAFMFVDQGADPGIHRDTVVTPGLALTVVGVKNYQEAVRVAGELAAEGIIAIELCAGFGVEGVAMVKKAVKGKSIVGVVRFDNHPGLQFKSGDDLYL